MTYEEVYNTIAVTDTKECNVVITTKESGKKYKQNLYISSGGRVKIRGYDNRMVAGYNVTPTMADKWESIRVVKRRTKKS